MASREYYCNLKCMFPIISQKNKIFLHFIESVSLNLSEILKSI